MDGYEKLGLAIFEQACEDYVNYCGCKGAIGAHLFYTAKKYLEENRFHDHIDTEIDGKEIIQALRQKVYKSNRRRKGGDDIQF